MGALVLALVALLAVPTAAVAHGGPFTLTIMHDGAGGLTVMGQYDEDGHIVEEIMDPVVTATASDGRVIGPVSLISASEGVGRWVTEEPVLEEGSWVVTVRTTTPDLAEAVAEFEVTPLEGPVEATPISESGTASGGSPLLWIGPAVAGVALVAVIVIVFLLVRRSRRARAG